MLAPLEKTTDQEGLITHKELLRILDYNSWTGLFRWKVNRTNGARVGDLAGCKDKSRGYIKFCLVIDGIRKTYLGHRLAWFYVYGIWPKGLIDHKDTANDHNWINNLREATSQQNNRNKGVTKSNSTGFKGVNPGKNGKFRSYICLGTFDTKEEAHEAYKQAALKLHGEFAHYSLTAADKLALNEK